MLENSLEIVSNDKRFGVRISEADGNSLTHNLSVDALDSLIASLIMARVTIEPEVTRTVPSGSDNPIVDPVWQTGQATLDKAGKREFGVALFLRHPGAGWLSFALPANEAKSLGGWLLTLSAQDRPN